MKASTNASPTARLEARPAASPVHRAADRADLRGAGPGAGAGSQVAASLLWLPQAALLAIAVQRIAEGGGLREVLLPALGIALLSLLRAVLDSWGAQRVHDLARDHLSALRADVAAALASRSPLDRDRPASGLAASVLAEQAEAVVPWLSRYRTARWRVMLVPPAIALAVLSLSWAAALILVLAMPLIPLFMALIGWRAKAASEAQMVELGQMNAFLLDRLRGLSTIRALDATEATARRLRSSAEQLRQRSMRVLRIAFLSSASLELFSALAVALVAVFVGFHLLGPLSGGGTWSGRLSLGQGLFILMLAPAFFEPLRELAAVWHDQAAGQAALALIEQHRQAGVPLPGALGATPATAATAAPSPDRTAPTPPPRPIAVATHGLRFHHTGEAPLFSGLDLDVCAGEHVALVGPSGSGKSTLLALLAGLIPANGGDVRVDDEPLAPHNAAALRARVAWIGQQPHVFAGSVRRNVALDRPGTRREDVAAALVFASLDGVANASLDGALGELGTGLSGGELVRLALARAAVHTNAGLLLADEPTAHLDPATAQQVTDALLRLACGRTLIVATHDAALIARLDRVIALSAHGTETRTDADADAEDTVADADADRDGDADADADADVEVDVDVVPAAAATVTSTAASAADTANATNAASITSTSPATPATRPRSLA